MRNIFLILSIFVFSFNVLSVETQMTHSEYEDNA
jgi:hypothetical protein